MQAPKKGQAERYGETADFFDEMAPRYDTDLVELGWSPLELVERWPFVAMPGMHVVDAGCGTGAVLEAFAGADRRLTGFDLSPAMIRHARRRRPLRNARIEISSATEAWPVETGGADRVIALAMLEFVQELDRALDELKRVMAPRARALVSVEDVVDMGGISREVHERRYDRFDLWRRSKDTFEMCIPPGLEIVRMERVPAYTVLEQAFICAYWVAELERV